MSSQPNGFFLDGPAALTNARSPELAIRLRSVEPSLVAVGAPYRHFVQFDRTPEPSEVARLARLLDYGEPFEPSAWAGSREALVVPRPGTVSPWSSKATDIARNCGFDWVARVERGTRVLLRFNEASGSAAQRPSEALLVHLHDRMTESVIEPKGAVRRLFEPAQRKALSSLELGGDARGALERANVQFGLALSADEIDYLAGAFSRPGTDPHALWASCLGQVYHLPHDPV